MANRTYAKESYYGDKDLVVITAVVAFNSSSAPSLLSCALSSGIYTVAPSVGTAHFKSFTRAGTGDYTLTLKDNFVRLIQYNISFIGSANAAAPICQVKVASDPTNGQAFGTAIACGTVRSGASSIHLLTFSAQGAAADPAATEVALIQIQLQNSTVI